MCSRTRRSSELAHSKCPCRLLHREILQRERGEGHRDINMQRSCSRSTELFRVVAAAPVAAAGAKACGCLGFCQGSHTQHTAGCCFCSDTAVRLALLGLAFAAQEKRPTFWWLNFLASNTIPLRTPRKYLPPCWFRWKAKTHSCLYVSPSLHSGYMISNTMKELHICPTPTRLPIRRHLHPPFHFPPHLPVQTLLRMQLMARRCKPQCCEDREDAILEFE